MTLLLDDALKRLDGALSLLEGAIARRSDGEKSRSDGEKSRSDGEKSRSDGEKSLGNLEIELQIMQDDRTHLAVELDAALTRLKRCETATEDVGRRVRSAMGAIRTVLDRARTLEPQDG